jgi:FkbM family methyltransferase
MLRRLALFYYQASAVLKRVTVLRRLYALTVRRNRYQQFKFSDWIRRGVKLTSLAGFRTVSFEDDQVWIRTKDGIEFAYITELEGEGLSADVYRGAYEQAVTKVLLSHLVDKKVFVDIGANIGWYSLMAAHHSPDLIVHAFEPGDLANKYLSMNVQRNKLGGRIHINKSAVCEHTGTVRFTNNKIGHALNYVCPSQSKMINTIEVESVTLDDYVRTNNLAQVDYIKCDVEGAEYGVLLGALETLNRFNPILFLEVDDTWMLRYGTNAEELFTLLSKAGYRYGVITDGGDILCTGDFQKDLQCSPNVMFQVAKLP